MNRAARIAALIALALAALFVPAAAQDASETSSPTADPVADYRPPPADVAAGSDAAGDEVTQDEQQQRRQEFIETIFSPGMWPIWICSIALVALLLERRRALRPSRITDPRMVDRVAELIGERKLAEAQQAAAESDTVLGRAWAQGLHEFELGGTSLAETLTASTAVAFAPLKRNLGGLATLGVISPLFGLLGTIVGMIIIFTQIAATGGADKAQLAGGIGLALFTTAGGLIVAIPAILGNRYFTGRLGAHVERAEEAINRINYRYSHAVAESKRPSESAAATQQGE